MTDTIRLALRLRWWVAACVVIAGLAGSAQVWAQTALPGAAATAATLRAQAQAELDERIASGEPMPAISGVRMAEGWGVVALAVPNAGTAGYAAGQTALAVHQGGDPWRILWPGDPGYAAAVQAAPDALLDPLAKAVILSTLPQPVGVAQAYAAAGGYRLPWPAGEAGAVTQNYNTHGLGQIDFFFGSGQVLAAKPGTVVYIQDSHTLRGCDAAYSRYNNVVVVRHSATEYTLYLHIATGSVPDALKQQLAATGPVQVAAGSLLARQGNVGYTCGADGIHLHLSTGSAYTIYTSPDSLDEDGDGNRDEPVQSAWTPAHQPVDFQEGTYDQLANWPFDQPIVSQNLAAPVCPVPGAGIVLYAAGGCGGAALPLAAETGLVNLPPLGWNDRARALAVAPGWSARVYLHAERVGPSRCLNATATDLDALAFIGVADSLDQAISSLQVYHSAGCYPAPVQTQATGEPGGVLAPQVTTPVTFTVSTEGQAHSQLREWRSAWLAKDGQPFAPQIVSLDAPLIVPGSTAVALHVPAPADLAAQWAAGQRSLTLRSELVGVDEEGRPVAAAVDVALPIDACGDAGEWNGSPSTATAIALGETITAALCPTGDVDTYVFTTQPNQRVVATVRAVNAGGAVYDPQVALLDSSSNPVATGDDAGEGRDGQLDVVLTEPEMYFVRVSTGDVGDTRPFSYTLALSASATALPPCSAQPDAAEPNDSALAGSTTDTRGSAIHATLHTPADEDWVAVPSVAGVTYRAAAAAKNQAPVLSLSDPNLETLDTAAGVTQTVVTWTAQVTGHYWLRAAAGAPAATGCLGGYTLAVQAEDAVAPTAALTINGAAPVTNNRLLALELSAADTGSGFEAWRYGADSSLAGAAWQADPTATYMLSPGDGMRTVFAQARDAAGNLSAVVTATVLLDTVAPAAQVTLAPGALLDLGQVTVRVDASSDATRLRLRVQGDTWGQWQPLAAPVRLHVGERSGDLVVEAQVQDAAGNVSAVSTLPFTYYPPALYLPLLRR